jgi:ATP-dependent RNA helicase DDX51/DBP6
MGNPAPADVVNLNSEGRRHQPNSHRSPTPLATLPSFPLPALPNAPPKSVLALQGLDQALVDAEIVDPSTLLPIPLDADNDAGTGLSEKMRRRLKELGITELFAGLDVPISRD